MGSAIGLVTTETPGFALLKTYPTYQIRQYAPQVRIQHFYSPTNGNVGFKPLANFIFGNNEAKQNISMTAPVLGHQSPGESDSIMEFILPSSFKSASDVPKPTDPRIKVIEIPQETLAVCSFSGSWDDAELVNTKVQELKNDATTDGYVLDPVRVVRAGYNPPWTPSFLRTSEVMIPILKMPLPSPPL